MISLAHPSVNSCNKLDKNMLNKNSDNKLPLLVPLVTLNIRLLSTLPSHLITAVRIQYNKRHNTLGITFLIYRTKLHVIKWNQIISLSCGLTLGS